MIQSKTKLTLTPHQYCTQLLRKYDYENFLISLLIQDPLVRRVAITARAFNVELSKICDLTTNLNSSQLRFKFWFDSINKLFSSHSNLNPSFKSNEPILYELQQCLLALKGKLSKQWFLKLINSRSSLINNNFPFHTLNELENYCDSSFSPVFFIIVEALVNNEKLGPLNQIKLGHIGSHIAKGQGLTNILRGLYHNSKYGRCYIPNETLIKFKISHQDFLNCKDSSNIRNACFDIASRSYLHLNTAKKTLAKDNQFKSVNFIFLPIIPFENYLERLKKVDFNVFDQSLFVRQGTLPFKIWFKSKLWKLGRI